MPFDIHSVYFFIQNTIETVILKICVFIIHHKFHFSITIFAIVMYIAEKKYKEAEPLYLHILDQKQSLYGQTNIETLQALNNVGVVYR